jgi:hypothetical protein
MRASAATIVSVAEDQGPPWRSKAAAITGREVSAKAGKSTDSMVF